MLVVLLVEAEVSAVWEVTSTTQPAQPIGQFKADWTACRTRFQSVPYFTDEVIDAVRACGWQLTSQEFLDVHD